MSESTNGNETINTLSTNRQISSLRNKISSEESVTDLFMTININSAILSQFMTDNLNSNLDIDHSLIENTNAIIANIINVMKENIRLNSSIEYNDDSIVNYRDYLHTQIEREKNKKKIYKKEINNLIDKEEKITDELKHIKKQPPAKGEGEKKSEVIIIINDPNRESMEMYNEIKNIEEINAKVNQLNEKEKTEIDALEKEFEMLNNKISNMVDNSEDFDEDDDDVKSRKSRKSRKSVKQNAFDYEKYFEEVEKECLEKLTKHQDQDVDFQEDNASPNFKTQQDNGCYDITRKMSRNINSRLNNNDNSPPQKRMSLYTNESGFKRKSLFCNIQQIENDKPSIENKRHSSNNKINKKQDLKKEYAREKKINQEYQLIIEKYKEIYNKYKLFASEMIS